MAKEAQLKYIFPPWFQLCTIDTYFKDCEKKEKFIAHVTNEINWCREKTYFYNNQNFQWKVITKVGLPCLS